MLGFQTIADLQTSIEPLRRRRYGVIELSQGNLRQIRLRPFPALVSVPEAWIWGALRHRCLAGDRCLLYYNQPLRYSNFLVLKYLVSSRNCSLRTLRRALQTLDEIARIKLSDALLCEVANRRITTPLLQRAGWLPHCPTRWHRHYIKRFYGVYPPRPAWLDVVTSAERSTSSGVLG